MTRILPCVPPLMIFILLLAACGSVLLVPPLTLEPLDRFPTDSIVIETHHKQFPFRVWIADTGSRRTQGLMYVRKLDADRGMLFLFHEPTRAAMWMNNMAIPIDLLFIADDGRVLNVARNAVPGSHRTIQAEGPVTGVIELPGGTVARLNLDTGDRVTHRHFKSAAH